MSTTPTEPTAVRPAPAPADAPAPTSTGYETLKPSAQATREAPAAPETDWKAEARKWEARSKENAEAAKRLAEIEESAKTEAQKQAERTAALEAKVKEYETREQIAAWKAEVAEASGVPAAVLAGSTKEEIEAHAATLKPLIEQQPTGLQPITGEGRTQPLPLNGDGIEAALKSALGIK